MLEIANEEAGTVVSCFSGELCFEEHVVENVKYELFMALGHDMNTT